MLGHKKSLDCIVARAPRNDGVGAANLDLSDPPRDARYSAFDRMMASLDTKNPPRIAAGGVLSETIHVDKNTTPDRTGQTEFEFFLHSCSP
jgi:hypothetical protein